MLCICKSLINCINQWHSHGGTSGPWLFPMAVSRIESSKISECNVSSSFKLRKLKTGLN